CCQNYHVVPVASGQEALQELASSRIDVVLLDLNLGQESGWSIFQEMLLLQPRLPIIIITGRPNDLYHHGLSAATACMEKPLDLPVLFRILDGLPQRPWVSSQFEKKTQKA